MRYIYGIDTASKVDYFAVIVHELPDYQPGVVSMPRIKTLRNISRMDYSKSITILTGELFKKYRPHFIVIDYAIEKTITDLLIKKFGEHRVLGVNTNTLPNKQMLKDDGLSIMQQGYQFPNPTLIPNKDLAKLVTMLITQLQSEEIVTTKSGKVSYDHGGEHNDLAIAWELSIHGCYKFILSESGSIQVSTRKYGAEIDEIQQSAYAHRPDIQILSREIHMPS